MVWEDLNENLILLDLDLKSSEEVFRTIGGTLTEEGYCKDTYVQALIDREKDFPTGINMGNFGIAIPHTDRGHVIKGGVAIGQLRTPVEFYQMGSMDEEVCAKLIFMLAVDDPKSHLTFLQRILQVVQDGNVLEKLIKAKSKNEIYEIIREKEELLEKEK